MTLTFVTGGARSGKSSYALQLAAEAGTPVALIATAEARDDEMRERIEAHRRERPAGWRTVEQRAAEAAELAARHEGGCVAVSNEVGMGIVPLNTLARSYRDALGRVNA